MKKIRPCIGCVYCCTKCACVTVKMLYNNGLEKCPELIWNGERHVCGLMLLPDPLGHQYRKELASGEGCCSSLNSWRYEPIIDRTTNI